MIDAPQRSAEWYAGRSGRITGSIAGACLGQCTHTSQKKAMRQLVREFHGEPSEKPDIFIFQYGRFCEPLATEAYEWETGRIVTPCGFFPFEDWLGASPDGLIFDDGLAEFKSPWNLRDAAQTPNFIEILPEYYAQVQIELFCTGRKWCDFVQWCPRGYKIERFFKDDRWLNINLPLLKEFHNQFKKELKNLSHLQPLPKRGKKRG